MSRSPVDDRHAEISQPFLVRHLPLILTLLFLAALHQPLEEGLAPQIDTVTALFADAEATQAVPKAPTVPALNASEIVVEPSSHPRFIAI